MSLAKILGKGNIVSFSKECVEQPSHNVWTDEWCFACHWRLVLTVKTPVSPFASVTVKAFISLAFALLRYFHFRSACNSDKWSGSCNWSVSVCDSALFTSHMSCTFLVQISCCHCLCLISVLQMFLINSTVTGQEDIVTEVDRSQSPWRTVLSPDAFLVLTYFCQAFLIITAKQYLCV